MSGFRLLNYAGTAGEACPGIAVGDDLIDLKAAGVSGSTFELLQNWDDSNERLSNIAASPGEHATTPLADANLLAPILYPPVVYNAAANYIDHQNKSVNLLIMKTSPNNSRPKMHYENL